ncbi:STAS domain-containing protein [Seonamhaeicola sp.]|uniref:STAS domain-containing protein n=1 Tax=Seonamhaeicola sp. TaxID=1912245 RepID=UPI0035660158
MALKIKEQDNVFMISGTINATTVNYFKNHLEFLMLYTNALTINIECVISIDNNGLKAIEELYTMALANKKPFKILGYGHKGIYDELRINQAA